MKIRTRRIVVYLPEETANAIEAKADKSAGVGDIIRDALACAGYPVPTVVKGRPRKIDGGIL